MPQQTIVLASLSPGTVLDTTLRFEMWNFKTVVDRRIGYFPGIGDGVVQDFGYSESDRILQGQPYVSDTQAGVLESMYESSTTDWGLSDGLHLYKVYFLSLEKIDSFANNKLLYDVKFGIKERLV